MPQFDVYRSPKGALALDCQTDRLGHLPHRFVVPLMPLDEAPKSPISSLNPVLTVDASLCAMLTQFAVSIPLKELGSVVANLDHERDAIIRAIDTLIGTA